MRLFNYRQNPATHQFAVSLEACGLRPLLH
jgi:hypothetical protein